MAGFKQTTRCAFLIALTVWCTIDAATVSVSYSPEPAVVGLSQTRVHCQYTLGQSESFYRLSLYDAPTGGNAIVEMGAADTNSNSVVWAPGAPQNIQDRAYIIASPGDRSLDLQFDATTCEDSNNVVYRCEVQYQAPNDDSNQVARGTVLIDVEARPKAPAMSVTPTTENVTEFTEITFTCTGNVGRPAGSFHWYTLNDDDGSRDNNVTLQATQGTAFQGSGADSCTFARSSVLTLNVTRREQGKRLVVRCRVYHSTQANVVSSQCQDPSTDYCATSQKIDVQYPVEVSVSSDAVNVEEGTGRTITCITSSNPLPYRVEWKKEGDSNTLSSSNDLMLSEVTLSDTGNYICTAYNTVGATTRNDSGTVFVTVLEAQKGHDEVDEATAADSTTTSKKEEPCDAQNVLALPDETSDVILEVEGRELHASRAVLAHYSPVFRKMFYSDFREKSQAKVPLHGKEFKSVVKFFNVMFPRTAASKTLVADANLIELLTLADEYQADQVKVVCQYYIGEQLSLYFHNFYNRHARDAANNPAPLNTPRLVKGNMEGQNVSKTELIEKLVLYMWACDQYELPEHREVVKSLLVSLISKLKEVTESRHYPSLPPLSKVDLLEALCGKFEKGCSELQDTSSQGQLASPYAQFGQQPTMGGLFGNR